MNYVKNENLKIKKNSAHNLVTSWKQGSGKTSKSQITEFSDTF